MFAERLKLLRSQTKMTQKEAAVKIGVAPTTYASWEQGKREPDISSQNKLADLYNVTLDYMSGRTNNPLPPSDNEPELMAAHLDKKYSDLSPEEQKQVDDFADYVRNKKRNNK
ncbi:MULTISPECIES: helix-turn-helix domain-containing protein [Companilactobacillus]|jgi:transcriptional regulator with XRE-family HTH domain|uniref:Helix-turn-helix transcriptional regulator n=1 Tax=Companilactobacillus pabuli TaxID=2714036 RepID=A0A7L7KWS4_9LACO|nr:MULTISPECIES: helix-turn-helix transcriptional regulator [Companilactobacillus]MDG5112648.1 helix-turn-helix transcriptional regulator [Companilactobacillus pabuli]QMT84240.1 helix-turn-helix transcriptional regulator [Companilactobacillus pabuli]WCG36283.1 helix-turn-helix transcriptional regulator [Companilactobacillus farciminis]GAQ01512.1 Cro/Cl family transcriptional regulator [Companilactobacillus farciminis]